MRTAIITLTKKGTELGRILHQRVEQSQLYVPTKFTKPDDQNVYDGSVRTVIADAFSDFDALILIMATGVAVRCLAPLIQDKRTDPAVIALDEAGRFAISLLSGHIGGANELAQKVASLINAQPVITTASDLQGTLNVDLLGQKFGWTIEHPQNITRVSAAVINGEKVGIVQTCGERDWWPASVPLPANLYAFDSLETLQTSGCTAGLLISCRLIDRLDGDWQNRLVIYRPKCLVVGIGMHRNTDCSQIETAVSTALEKATLSFKSLRNLATIDTRQSEAGLIKFARTHGLPIQAFTKEQLNAVFNIPHPSEIVHRHIGVRGVCEPAALLSANPPCERGKGKGERKRQRAFPTFHFPLSTLSFQGEDR
ncbi:TPA: precorrin-3B C(17)-methyltransferase, partial [Candidatus Poribacteria bacterium]|nr:precorrin-3B C(17)-methyltransferase [Candidatus Poribacteria bacterium]